MASSKNTKTKLSASDLKALARAIELGLEPKVKAALAKNPDLNVVVKSKYSKTTPLLDAAQRSSVQIVKLLLAAGADPNFFIDDRKTTPLHCASSGEIARALIAAGANVDGAAGAKWTPLHAAHTNAAVTEALLEGGAKVDPKDGEGKTPYVHATDLEVRALLKKHGSRGLPTTDGRALKPKKRSLKPADVDVDGEAIAVDAATGRVWIGTSDGIACWDGGKSLTRYEFEESFSVDTIAVAPGKLVYFATNWGLVTFANDAWRLYSMEDSDIHDNHLTEMFIDRKGRAYVLGYGEEKEVDRPISIFDPTKKKIEHLTAGEGLARGLEITSLAFDEKNGMIIGTRGGVILPNGKEWRSKKGGSMGEVRALEVDKRGVWAGLWQGVHLLDPQSAKEKEFYPTTDGVKCIALSPDGKKTWVGLSYGGLLEIESGQLYKSDTSSLPDDDVEGLALGRDGTLWIAAGCVLAVMKNGVIKPFDGKPIAETAPAKITKAKPKKEEEKPPERKLAPMPRASFVPLEKLPKHVVDAVRGAKLEGLTAEDLLKLVRPSIGFEIGAPKSAPVGASKLGGRPDLPKGVAWPAYEDDEDRKLPFLLQVNASDVAKYDLEGLLPKKGLISFFAETIPDTLDTSKVLYSDPAKKLTRQEWPEDLVDRKSEEDFVAQLPEYELTFYPTWTLPSTEYLSAFAHPTDKDRAALRSIDEMLHSKDPKRSSTTRILGWPDNVQGEFVSSPKDVVLLQLDASMAVPKPAKAIDQMFRQWGDGLVHFMVSEKDLAKGKLDKTEGFLAYT